MKTKLIFVRHAQAEGNVLREYHGWTNSGITEDGHKQAMFMAMQLKDVEIDLLYSSSMKRTLQTAQYISKLKNIPITRTDRLKEMNGGDWECVKFLELPSKYPVESETWDNQPHLHQMPNGESMVEFQLRLIDEVEKIIRQNRGKNICIVTHGTAIRALMCHFMHADLSEMLMVPWYDNTSITIIEKNDDTYSIIQEGDASHLDESLSTVQNQEWWQDHIKKLEGIKKGMMSKNLVKWLFSTNAFRVCPPGKPFWYTSGTIGPYYINTHFLYGSEQKAVDLLKFIDTEKVEQEELTYKLWEKTKENYYNDEIYKGLIDAMVDFIKNNIAIDDIDYISGGERRDWFFSVILADILGKPHITIFKDMDAYAGKVNDPILNKLESLEGAKVLHIADLITEASSYERAWVPAINSLGGKMLASLVVVDRMQGGAKVINELGVQSFAMVSIDEELFNNALAEGLINEAQQGMLLDFFHNPKESMKNFLMENQSFLEEALNSDSKTSERAKLCIEKGIYGLNR